MVAKGSNAAVQLLRSGYRRSGRLKRSLQGSWRGCLRADPALLGASAIRKDEGLVGVAGQQALAVLGEAPSLLRSVASQGPDHVVALLRPAPALREPRQGLRRGDGAGQVRQALVLPAD